MIDTHAHLQDRRYRSDLVEVLKRAAKAGVTAAIVPGTDLESSREAIALAERYATAPCALYATIGYHPTGAQGLTPQTLAELRELARHPRVVGIGEIGLDYYWPRQPKRKWPCASPPQQRKAFREQLDLAADLKLPVVIHDREAHEDTLEILRAWVAGGTERRGTYHAYAAGPLLLDEVLEAGFYVGMDGPVTFKSAADLHQVARLVPADRLLLETDAPYLTPHPYRGKRNEPAYVAYVAQRIAELRGAAPKTIDRETTENARRLFGAL